MAKSNDGGSRQRPSAAGSQRANQGAQPGAVRPVSAQYKPQKGGQRAGAQPSAQPGMGGMIPATAAGQYSRNAANYTQRKRGMSTPAKVFIVILVLALIAGLGYFGYKTIRKAQINKDFRSGYSEQEFMEINEKMKPVKSFDEPFYVMLIGSDRRADDPSMGARSDTNIVVRVDVPNQTVTMVSIPRDTRVLVGGSYMKFNAIYNYEGPSGVIDEAGKLLGVDISYFAEVNFEEMTDLVDAIGGIDVEVPETINDPDAGDQIIEAGPQHLDGTQALIFARSRAYADGDFTRQSNQRLIIEAIIDKALTTPASELMGLISTSTKFVTTNFTVDDIYDLAEALRKGDGLKIYSCMIPSTTDMIDGVSYVICDEVGTRELMRVVDAGEDPATANITSGAATGGAYSKTESDHKTINSDSGASSESSSSSSSSSGTSTTPKQ